MAVKNTGNFLVYCSTHITETVRSKTAIMDKSLGTLLHLWGVFQSPLMPNPFPHPTNNVGQNFFLVLTLYMVGGGTVRKVRNECTVIRGTQKLQKIMNIALLSQEILFMIVSKGT